MSANHGENPENPFAPRADGSGMRRALSVVVLLLIAIALVAAPVTAHINHAGTDSQVSENGTVVVETAYILADGWLVLHRDDGGEPGEVIGYTRIGKEGGLKTDVTVSVDESAWANWSNQTVWATLHRNRGASTFDPKKDTALRFFGRPSGDPFILAKGERAVVTVSGFAPQRTTGNVTVRRATLPSDGYVVLHNGSTDGEVVGHVALSAGTHRNVSVPVDESFLRGRDRATLVAALYADDGDGQFDDGDRIVRAGKSPVATKFGVYPRLNANGTATPTPSLVTTPTPGAEDTATTSESESTTGSPASGFGPGFGVSAAVASLIAVVSTLLVRVSRR